VKHLNARAASLVYDARNKTRRTLSRASPRLARIRSPISPYTALSLWRARYVNSGRHTVASLCYLSTGCHPNRWKERAEGTLRAPTISQLQAINTRAFFACWRYGRHAHIHLNRLHRLAFRCARCCTPRTRTLCAVRVFSHLPPPPPAPLRWLTRCAAIAERGKTLGDGGQDACFSLLLDT